MSKVASGLMICAAAAAALVSGGIPITAIAATPIQAVGVWEALGLLSNIIAPLIGAITGIIVWFHRRINSLEESQDDLEKSVFGSDRDALNEGVLLEVRNVNQRLSEIQETVEELRRENKKIRSVQQRSNEEIAEEERFDRED